MIFKAIECSLILKEITKRDCFVLLFTKFVEHQPLIPPSTSNTHTPIHMCTHTYTFLVYLCNLMFLETEGSWEEQCPYCIMCFPVLCFPHRNHRQVIQFSVINWHGFVRFGRQKDQGEKRALPLTHWATSSNLFNFPEL